MEYCSQGSLFHVMIRPPTEDRDRLDWKYGTMFTFKFKKNDLKTIILIKKDGFFLLQMMLHEELMFYTGFL